MTNFKSDGPITQARAENAADWMVTNAANIARAKAYRDYCDDRLKVIKAIAMGLSDEKSAASREQEAYASKSYSDAIEEKRMAIISFETLMNTRIAAQTIIDMWRSINSTQNKIGL